MNKETAEFKCDGTWKSKVNGSDDGIFDLNVDKAGNITGKHILPSGTKLNVTGKCKHTPDHHMEIKEKRDGKNFRYHARVVPKTSGEHVTNGGKRSQTAESKTKKDPKNKLTDDETWTGVRTT